jgi:hypothetical protein
MKTQTKIDSLPTRELLRPLQLFSMCVPHSFVRRFLRWKIARSRKHNHVLMLSFVSPTGEAPSQSWIDIARLRGGRQRVPLARTPVEPHRCCSR